LPLLHTITLVDNACMFSTGLLIASLALLIETHRRRRCQYNFLFYSCPVSYLVITHEPITPTASHIATISVNYKLYVTLHKTIILRLLPPILRQVTVLVFCYHRPKLIAFFRELRPITQKLCLPPFSVFAAIVNLGHY